MVMVSVDVYVTVEARVEIDVYVVVVVLAAGASLGSDFYNGCCFTSSIIPSKSSLLGRGSINCNGSDRVKEVVVEVTLEVIVWGPGQFEGLTVFVL